jgi:hypothetical protein
MWWPTAVTSFQLEYVIHGVGPNSDIYKDGRILSKSGLIDTIHSFEYMYALRPSGLRVSESKHDINSFKDNQVEIELVCMCMAKSF